MKHIILYFGSFNPVHNGHTSVAGYVVGEGLCDELWFVVSPQNPFKTDYRLAPEQDRLRMADIAVKEMLPALPVCVSDFETGLPKPSYTIDTLRALSKVYPECRFSLLIGTDLTYQLKGWKDSQELLSGYSFYVYPRNGYSFDGTDGDFIFLAGAPTFDYSSTDVREALQAGQYAGDMICSGVMRYIAVQRLYRQSAGHSEGADKEITEIPEAANQVGEVIDRTVVDPDDIQGLMKRGKAYYKDGKFDLALNDFLKVCAIQPENKEAKAYADQIREIFEFRYMDYYNP